MVSCITTNYIDSYRDIFYKDYICIYTELSDAKTTSCELETLLHIIVIIDLDFIVTKSYLASRVVAYRNEPYAGFRCTYLTS